MNLYLMILYTLCMVNNSRISYYATRIILPNILLGYIIFDHMKVQYMQDKVYMNHRIQVYSPMDMLHMNTLFHPYSTFGKANNFSNFHLYHGTGYFHIFLFPCTSYHYQKHILLHHMISILLS